MFINTIKIVDAFLRKPYLRDIFETQYQKHAPECTSPETCSTNQNLENALYSVNQQFDFYNDITGALNPKEKPAMSFFKEGQYFDAYTSIKEVIKKAKTAIILVDGYVNEDTLAFFPGKEPSIKLRILTGTKGRSTEFQRAIELYNKQYENLSLSSTSNFHDRFLIIDDQFFYHIGASIKDAGNKVFMYTEILDSDIQDALRKKILSEWPDIYN